MNEILGKSLQFQVGKKRVSGKVILEVAPGIKPGKAFRLLPADVRKGLEPLFTESEPALMEWSVLLSDGKRVHWLKRDNGLQDKSEVVEEEITAE